MTALPAIPDGWARCCLGELVEVIRGVSYQKAEAHDAPAPGLVPILRANNIGEKLNFEDIVYVPESRVSDNQLLRVGDIVVAASSGSRAVVGKAAPLQAQWHGAFGAFCMVVRPSERVNPRYVASFMATREYRTRVSLLAAGVNINNLRRQHVLETPIVLAPRPEQDRIVAEIEKQFTRLDSGVAALERLQAHLRRYRAAVLVQLTRGWDLVPLGDLLREPLCNGKSAKGSASPPGLPVLRLNAMTPDGFDYSCVRYAPLAWGDYKDIGVSEGDFFVSRGNGTLSLVGRGTLAQMPPARIIFPDTMIRVRLRPELQETRWIPTIWSSRVIREQIESKAKTTAGIWKISQGDLASVSVPLPPAAKQRELVDIAAGEFSGVIQQEAAVERAIARAARLRASILRAAFEGRLVAP